ncbi:hypothetical protein J7400_13200 [Shimia sp. R9_2]|uniref:hypothetical protein n=1 Tax=Shimia sp. R9_2 TaxID=2821112 RepID=UPI001AD995F0|nr:hypothetical protein [Shimia sp. R9_2]MBO9397638.1 hypothetical protein [Shimia sp. R9_2]
MQFVSTSFIAVFLCSVLLLQGPYRGLWAFMVSLPFGAAAAISFPAVGGTSLLVSDIVLLVMMVQLFFQRRWFSQTLGTLRPYRPGFWLLLCLIGAVVSAIFLPRLFVGQTEVFQVVRYEDRALPMLQPLQPSNSNIAQAFRLLLSASAFLVLATLYRLRPEPQHVVGAMAAALAVHAALGFADVASYALGMPDLLSVIRTSGYQMLDHQMLLGAKRMVGGFPEPSSFGYYTIGLFGFWLRYWVGDRSNVLAIICLLAVTVMVLRSTSSGTYAAVGAFMLIFLGLQLRHMHLDHLPPAQVRMLGAVAVLLPLFVGTAVLILNLVPAVGDYFDHVLFSKLSSSSGVERMSWNRQAFVNFWDTWTLGAGIGSVRGNGWLGATLGNIGLVGTLLFGAFLVGVIRARAVDPASQQALVVSALQYGCGAVFLQAMLTKTTPNLGTEFFAMAGLAVGIARGSELLGRPMRPVPFRSKLRAGTHGVSLNS